MKLSFLIFLLFNCFFLHGIESSSPNFIFILADDLGFNDVGFRNPDILTPNIDDLARNGMILSRSYVQPLCTPSRSAFLTGMYPYHIGRQGAALGIDVPTGLTLERKLLPEYLKELGYSTHLVGKWHLGFCKEEYTPPNRGFDSYYGYWNGAEDYFSKVAGKVGFDFHDGKDSLFDDEYAKTTYSTHLYKDRIVSILNNYSSSNSTNPFFLYVGFQTPHTPHAVPEEYEDLYPHIEQPLYRTYYAMITAMDEAIGEMTSSLKNLGLYENTVIVFIGDNGAPKAMVNSNTPLKGYKGTEFEGGTRTAAFIHSPLIPYTGVNEKLIHITDWLPTFLTLAGVQDLPEGLDGFNQAGMLFGDEAVPSARPEMVYNIHTTDDVIGTSGAIRVENWKLLVNQEISIDKYLLFDLESDPNETTNLKDDFPEIFEQMMDKYNSYAKTMVPEDEPDPVTDGLTVDGVFVSGWC